MAKEKDKEKDEIQEVLNKSLVNKPEVETPQKLIWMEDVLMNSPRVVQVEEALLRLHPDWLCKKGFVIGLKKYSFPDKKKDNQLIHCLSMEISDGTIEATENSLEMQKQTYTLVVESEGKLTSLYKQLAAWQFPIGVVYFVVPKTSSFYVEDKNGKKKRENKVTFSIQKFYLLSDIL